MKAAQTIELENEQITITEEPVTRVVKLIHFPAKGIKRPLDEVWKILCDIDPARLPAPIHVKIADAELRTALEELKVIKTMHTTSYAGKLYYNFVQKLSKLVS